MSKKIKIKPKLNKSANSDWEIVDDVSMKGYSDNSPYRDRKSIDIHSPNGLIDMSETGMPILANGKFLPPYSGMHQFEPGVVREERIMQNGGNFKNYNWKENREYKNNPANLNSSGGLDVGVSKNLPLGLNSSVGVGFDEDKVNYRAGLGYNNNGLRVNTDYNSSGRLNASVNYNSPIGLNAGFRYSDNKGEETYSGNVGYRGEKIPVGLNAGYIHTPKGHNANANLNFNTKNINGNFGYEYNQGGNNHSFNTGVNIPFLGGMGDIGINSKYNIGNKQPSVNVEGIFKFQDGGSIPIMQTGGRAPIQTENEWEILEEAQNGVKIKPKYEWSNQQTTNPSITTQGNNNVSRTEGNRKLTKQETEQLAKYTEIQNQLNKEKEYSQRKQNIQQSNEAQGQPLSAENLRTQTQATGDKFSLAMNSKYGNPKDYPTLSGYMQGLDYINPAKMIGDMASGLGSVPQDIKQGNYLKAGLSVASPLAVGAIAGVGANGVKPFVNNLANPFAGTKEIVNNLDNKYLPKFKSEINWSKWNKEIPENKALMQEYNSIEQQTKADGTWMKNPDGSAFNGTPEQFVQQNSENFKKAFPEYHGEILNHNTNAELNTIDESFFNKGAGDTGYYGKGTYTHPKKDYTKMYGKNNYEFYLNSKNKGFLDKSNIDDAEYFKRSDDEILQHHLPEYENKLMNYELDPSRYYDNAKENWLNKLNEQVKAGKISRDKLDEFTSLHNPKNGEVVIPFNNRVKSAIGNNGMFDMTNPNIYKALVPGVIGLGAASQIDKKQNGGTINKLQDGGNTKLTKEEVLRAVQQAEEANRSNKYEPTQAVKNTKAALSSISLLAPTSLPARIGSSIFDLGTATKYALDGQYGKAAEDVVQAGLNWIPFLKQKNMINLSKNTVPLAYRFNQAIPYINQVNTYTNKANDVKTISEVYSKDASNILKEDMFNTSIPVDNLRVQPQKRKIVLQDGGMSQLGYKEVKESGGKVNTDWEIIQD